MPENVVTSDEDAEVHRSRLHHTVFAIEPEHQSSVAQLFKALGFELHQIELAELGLKVYLDWDGGIELISPAAGSKTETSAAVRNFLDQHGNGVYTVVLRVSEATAAESIAQRYGSETRFRQHIEGEGTFVHEIDLAVFNLPLTFLATNMP